MTAPAWMLQKAAAHEARVAEVQRQRREQMPTVAGVLDQFRAMFGQQVTLHDGDEGNGRTFGKPIPVEETLSSTEVLRMLEENEKRLGQRRSSPSKTLSSLSVDTSAAHQKRGVRA